MILIKKQHPPIKYLEYCATPNAVFDGLNSNNGKTELRESLLEEQGYICAYCMSKLTGDGDVKIEHFIPRNKENELKYKNLLAVCLGNEGHPLKEQHCDTRKGDHRLEFIDPQNEYVIKKIKYKRDGTIYSDDVGINDELNQYLNLNYPNGYLKRNRRNAVKKLFCTLKKAGTNANVKRTLNKLKRDYLREGTKEAYVGILLYFIEKKLKANDGKTATSSSG